jgi:hypothetical protein
VDPESLKLAEDIEVSRQEIAKLQERVRQLVARRGKRAELVKSTHILSGPELPAEAATIVAGGARAATNDEVGKELSLEEGMVALKSTAMSEVRLIAFKHGCVIFLLANERTISVRMDERGPKPLLDLLTANDKPSQKNAPSSRAVDKRPRQ